MNQKYCNPHQQENVTNDGATILKAIQLDKVQDDDVGDGTTVTVLAAELPKRGGRSWLPRSSICRRS